MALTNIPPEARWEETRLLIFNEFARVSADLDAAHAKIRDLQGFVEQLKLKAAAAGGAVAVLIEVARWSFSHIK